MMMTHKIDLFSVPSLSPEALRAPGYWLRNDADADVNADADDEEDPWAPSNFSMHDDIYAYCLWRSAKPEQQHEVKDEKYLTMPKEVPACCSF